MNGLTGRGLAPEEEAVAALGIPIDRARGKSRGDELIADVRRKQAIDNRQWLAPPVFEPVRAPAKTDLQRLEALVEALGKAIGHNGVGRKSCRIEDTDDALPGGVLQRGEQACVRRQTVEFRKRLVDGADDAKAGALVVRRDQNERVTVLSGELQGLGESTIELDRVPDRTPSIRYVCVLGS